MEILSIDQGIMEHKEIKICFATTKQQQFLTIEEIKVVEKKDKGVIIGLMSGESIEIDRSFDRIKDKLLPFGFIETDFQSLWNPIYL